MTLNRLVKSFAAAMLLSVVLTPTLPAFAQAPTCTGAIRNVSVAVARGPEQKNIMREVRRKAPAEWSAAVAKQCPRLDPTWLRAKKRTVKCGFFSSSLRYTCILVGAPALKKRR
jgi:hypothetical protein